jgi:cytochrome oxidase Cu insertion factor (SCO1/SenC/PrrC family)
MGSHNYSITNSLVTSMFIHSAFVTSVIWILGIAFVVMAIAVATRRVLVFNLSDLGLAEPRNRTYLRIAFGVIWVIDGILQFQVSMPLGLGNLVVAPTANGTPSWLHSLIEHGVLIWNNHPIALADGAAWIQVGIGVLLVVSNAGVGRVAAVVSVGWAALIWLVGNGAGGIFAQGNNFLFGWPGATFFYVIAGVWLALEPRNFSERFSRITLRIMSLVFVGAIVLQVLPSRGFWHGGNANALTTMSQSMDTLAQPHWLSSIVRQVGVLAGNMGGGYNVIIILWLAACASGLWGASVREWRWPIWTVVVGCVYFWITVQDAAIFGGLATDLNSLIPVAVLTFCASPQWLGREPVRRRLPRELRASSGSVLASFATGMVAFSVVSMSIASFASAETTLYVAQNGSASATNTAAPGFTLTDQHLASYTLGEHPGHYTVVTFLDPVCYTDCPLLAAQLKGVAQRFGASAKLDLVAVAANPLHETEANVQHFIQIHQLASVKNFYFVTGSVKSLSKVWDQYGIQVISSPQSTMSVHSDLMFVINPQGHIKWIVPDDPNDAPSLQGSSVSELTALLHSSGLA